jgi:hypothetical protein
MLYTIDTQQRVLQLFLALTLAAHPAVDNTTPSGLTSGFLEKVSAHTATYFFMRCRFSLKQT